MTRPTPDAKSVFGRASEMPSPTARAAFLDDACAGHPAVRAEVEALLKALSSAGPFMRHPAAPAGETAPHDAPIDEGEGTAVGPYTLREQIGEGGMGLVFVAEQTHPVRRKVALKVIKPGMDTREVIARFEAERQALALMDHPNIARVFDAGATDAGRPYFVMELVKGVPITEYADAHHLTPKDRLGLFVQVCQAVQHAHQKGVIHRDIKPSNVLVAPHDGVPVVKVIDFGVAKALGQSLTEKTIYTRFAQMIGTPLYMSPEQAEVNQLDADTRSDVYSLGVLLYELLTGTTPFDGDRFREAAFDEIRRIIREEEPPRPSTRLTALGATLTAVSARRGTDPGRLAGLVRGELDWIVMRCLEKDRTRRYDSAAGLAKDVGCYLAGDAVEACPPTLGYRLKKAYRRNRPVILTGGAFASVLFAAAGVSLAFGVAATRAGREAEARRVESDDNARKAQANEDRAQHEASNVRAEQDRTRRLLHASEMNHAFLDALEFRTGRVLDRLAAAVPKPGEPDLRGWEWHHLDRLAHSWTGEVTLDAGPLAGRTDLFVRQGDAGPTNRSVAELAGAFFTADGTRLIIPAARPVPIPGVDNPDRKDGPGGVFDTKTGKLLATHAAKGAFSADGTWVASPKGGAARVVRLTEIATGREVEVDLGAAEGERGGPPRVGLGGERVTATTVVWGKPLVQLSKELSEKLKEVAPKAPRDFAVGRFKFQPIDALHVAVWAAGRPLQALKIAGPKDGLDLIGYEISPDGGTAVLVRQRVTADTPRQPASVPRETTVEFLDLTVAPPVSRATHSLSARQAPPVQFSAGGRACAVVEGEQAVGVFDAPSGKPIGRATLALPITSTWLAKERVVHVSDDGSRVLSIVHSRRAPAAFLVTPVVRPGRVSPGAPAAAPLYLKTWSALLADHSNPPLHLSADGGRVLAACPDGTVQAWELLHPPGYAASWPAELTVNGVECQGTAETGGPWVVYRPKGWGPTSAVKPVRPCPLALYDPARGQVVRTVTLDRSSDETWEVQASPDGRRLLVAGRPRPSTPLTTLLQDVARGWAASTAWTLWSLDDPDKPAELCRFDVSTHSVSLGTQANLAPLLTPDGRFLLEPVIEPPASAGPNGLPEARGYRVRGAADGRLLFTIRLLDGEQALTVPALAAGGTRFVVVTAKGPGREQDGRPELSVRGFDAGTGAPVWTWAIPAPPPQTLEPRPAAARPAPVALYSVLMVNISADGTRFAVGPRGVRSDARVWVLETAGGILQRELTVPGEWSSAYSLVALGPAGQVVAQRNSESVVWDATSAEPRARLAGFTWQLYRPVFSADGRRLFTIDNYDNASSGRVVRVWCLDTGRELMWLTVPTTPGSGVSNRLNRPLSIEGDRLYVQMADGVRVFDGSPLAEAKKP